MKKKQRINTTLFDLVKCVDELSSSEKESVEVVKHIINTKKVVTRKKSNLKVAA